MTKCICCNKNLDNGMLFIYLNNRVYKSCPKCSQERGEHIFKECPEAFGITPKRITQSNLLGLQSQCKECRANSFNKAEHSDYGDVTITCSDAFSHGAILINNYEAVDAIRGDIEYTPYNGDMRDSVEIVPLARRINRQTNQVQISSKVELKEGAKRAVILEKYERNPRARRICLEYYKQLNNGHIRCEICGFEFSKVYGNKFDSTIEVHHITPISSKGEEYEVNPMEDLLPVCPNCHTVIHSRKPEYSPDEVRDLMNLSRK